MLPEEAGTVGVDLEVMEEATGLKSPIESWADFEGYAWPDPAAIDLAARRLAGMPVKLARANFCDLPEVLDDHIAPLGVPAWYGSMIGHIKHYFTVPLGIEAEIDADAGTIKLLEPAVV